MRVLELTPAKPRATTTVGRDLSQLVFVRDIVVLELTPITPQTTTTVRARFESTGLEGGI